MVSSGGVATIHRTRWAVLALALVQACGAPEATPADGRTESGKTETTTPGSAPRYALALLRVRTPPGVELRVTGTETPAEIAAANAELLAAHVPDLQRATADAMMYDRRFNSPALASPSNAPTASLMDETTGDIWPSAAPGVHYAFVPGTRTLATGAAIVVGWKVALVLGGIVVLAVAAHALWPSQDGPADCFEIDDGAASICIDDTTIADLTKNELVFGYRSTDPEASHVTYVTPDGEAVPLDHCDEETDTRCRVIRAVVDTELAWKKLADPWLKAWLQQPNPGGGNKDHQSLLYPLGSLDTTTDRRPGCSKVKRTFTAWAATPAVPCGPLLYLCATVVVCSERNQAGMTPAMAVYPSARTVVVPAWDDLLRLAAERAPELIPRLQIFDDSRTYEKTALALRLLQTPDSHGFEVTQADPERGWMWYERVSPLGGPDWFERHMRPIMGEGGSTLLPVFVNQGESGAAGVLRRVIATVGESGVPNPLRALLLSAFDRSSTAWLHLATANLPPP